MNNRKYLAGVGVFLLTVLAMIELPYSDASIIELIIPPIKFETDGAVTSVFYLSGVLSVAGFIYSTFLIVKSKKFNTNVFVVYIVMFVVMLPIVRSGLDIAKIPIYHFSQGVRSIELLGSRINLDREEDKMSIHMRLELKGHRSDVGHYRVGIRLNDRLSEDGESAYYEIPYEMQLHPGVNIIVENFEVNINREFENDKILGSIIRNESYEIVLRDDRTESVLIRTDIDD